jgi:thiol:disulfide interchange protein DsbD
MMVHLNRPTVFAACVGAALALGGVVPAGPAAAQADPGDGPHAIVSLVSESAGVAPGETLRLGLRQKIQPGWHTYWVNPGDSGLPTTIDWSLPQGFVAAPIVWPRPERIAYGPLVSYGYEGDVVLPVSVTAPADLATGAKVTLSGHASWLVCSDVCVPEESDVSVTLPVVAGPPGPDPSATPLFAR